MKDYGMVSIIMPAWNNSLYVQDAIKSVQDQTYSNWELLIQDDCSIDSTEEIALGLSKKDKRIKYERNDHNCGAAITRNNALRRANGKWIAFLDSDDLWQEQKLEKQLAFMTEKRYHFSYTDYVEILESSLKPNKYISGPYHITRFGMYCYCWPGCLTVMYDRERIGLIQINNIRKNNDYAMWLKISQVEDCYLLPEPLAMYRKGRAGSISTQNKIGLIKWHYKLFKECEGFSAIQSFILTIINLTCGVYKKIRYTKKISNVIQVDF